MQLSVLTWNIHKGFTADRRSFVLHRMRELLRDSGVDLALLQEVQGEHRQHAGRIGNWPAQAHFEFLADSVWPHYAYGKNAVFDASHHGNAILSKYPFAQWDNINVSPLRRASRSLLHGTLTMPESTLRLHVVCVHFGLIAFERRGQLRVLNRHLELAKAEHDAVIVGGDFNDWTGRQVRRLLDPALGLQEAFLQRQHRHARTFPARWPLFAVDRIYFTGVELRDCARIDTAQCRELSDHLPLMAQFELQDA
jgi:endonuclease/exonuclease/phosphatase family metal-dependent hydrolase